MTCSSRSIKPIAGVFLATGLLWVYYAFDPAQDFFPKCPFLWLTHWKCPGCGSQRALHQLLQGNLAEALRFNFLFVTALPYVLFGLILEYTPWGMRQINLRKTWYGFNAILVVLVLVLTFGVLRNIWDF